MKPGVVAGAVAGAVGAVIIEVVSYGDILLRGRPPSELPAEAARSIADRLGVSLGDSESEPAQHRAGALGALMGHGGGVLIGALYGFAARGNHGGPLRGLALGAAAMVPTNVLMVAMGLTDPRTWGLDGWLSDIVPHVAYGFATAGVYRAITAGT